MLNTDSGDVIAKTDISGDCDDLFYDTKRQRAYAICGAGKIDVIDQIDPNTYRVSTTIGTAEGARTGLFVTDATSYLLRFHIEVHSKRRFAVMTSNDSRVL